MRLPSLISDVWWWLLLLVLLTILGMCDVPISHAADSSYRTDHQLTTYWYTTDKHATVAWDANSDYQMGDQFELKVVWLETSQAYLIATTPELTYSIRAPRVGHFEIFIRTKRNTLTSDWARSTNPTNSTVDRSPK